VVVGPLCGTSVIAADLIQAIEEEAATAEDGMLQFIFLHRH